MDHRSGTGGWARWQVLDKRSSHSSRPPRWPRAIAAAGLPGRPTARCAPQQLAPQQQPAAPQQQPAIVANNAALPGKTDGITTDGVTPSAQHPLEPALQMAYAAINNIRNNIKDYSCTMVKRERINGKLNDQEFMFLKVRHEPFSVYMYFLGPEKLRGQEAIYVEGKNNGNLLGHGVGIKKIAGTVPLAADRRYGHAGSALPDHRDRHAQPDQAAGRSGRGRTSGLASAK